VVGVEVFERDASYDVRVDPIARVEMGRLRAKLLEYYATEGAGDEIIIEIPKGGYSPRLVVRGPSGQATQPPVTGWRLWLWAAATIVLSVSGHCAGYPAPASKPPQTRTRSREFVFERAGITGSSELQTVCGQRWTFSRRPSSKIRPMPNLLWEWPIATT